MEVVVATHKIHRFLKKDGLIAYDLSTVWFEDGIIGVEIQGMRYQHPSFGTNVHGLRASYKTRGDVITLYVVLSVGEGSALRASALICRRRCRQSGTETRG